MLLCTGKRLTSLKGKVRMNTVGESGSLREKKETGGVRAYVLNLFSGPTSQSSCPTGQIVWKLYVHFSTMTQPMITLRENHTACYSGAEKEEVKDNEREVGGV